jgi:ubiquinone/menaquinone biosynthesis C-methylase UbiE
MDFTNLIEFSKKPQIYAKGNAVMWTNDHISKQLLYIHLNPDIDLASRRRSSIERTVDWILKQVNIEKMSILDLGCGHGLYAEPMAERGHHVTSLDFSKNSIEYARKEAIEKNLNIKYVNKNYLELCDENKFDLIMMIYTDFGVLVPQEREVVLQNVYRALKYGGTFVFDVLSEKDIEMKITEKSWGIEESGFWKDKPYLILSDSFYYSDDKDILYQHIVIDNSENIDLYRF